MKSAIEKNVLIVTGLTCCWKYHTDSSEAIKRLSNMIFGMEIINSVHPEIVDELGFLREILKVRIESEYKYK